MSVSIDRRHKVFVMSPFYLKLIFEGTLHINLIIFTTLTLLYKDNCNSAPSPTILTIFSTLETLDYFLFFRYYSAFCKNCHFLPDIYRNKKETYDGGPSGHIITRLTNSFFCNYEPFVSRLCNVFSNT